MISSIMLFIGKYVPWLASTVIARNRNTPNKINLKAVGIGDGWFAPSNYILIL